MFDQNDQLDQDMAATMAEIDKGGSPASDSPAVPDGKVQSPSEPSTAGAAPAATPDPAGTPAERAAWESLPKSWKKDYEADWTKADSRIKQYVHEREKQSLDGLMQYKNVADKWSGTVKPFEQAFKQLGIDPHQIFGSVANNHMMLKYGTPEQRKAVWGKLVEDYQLQEFMQAQPQAQPMVPPALLARLDQLDNAFRQQQLAAAQTEVEKFFSNPENEFAKEVASDMNQFLEAGLATDLPKAYELAIWHNPTSRQKLLERRAAELAGNRPPTKELKSSATPPSPTGGVTETLDETLENTLAKIRSRT